MFFNLLLGDLVSRSGQSAWRPTPPGMQPDSMSLSTHGSWPQTAHRAVRTQTPRPPPARGQASGCAALPPPAPILPESSCLSALGRRGRSLSAPAYFQLLQEGRACLSELPGWPLGGEESARIREPAPNPAYWVLQGSEPQIMNLIKGEQEPQSDLRFSL